MQINSYVSLITNSSTVIYTHPITENIEKFFALMGLENVRAYSLPEYFYMWEGMDEECLAELDAIFGFIDDEVFVYDELANGTIDHTNIDIFVDILKRLEVNKSDYKDNHIAVIVETGKPINMELAHIFNKMFESGVNDY